MFYQLDKINSTCVIHYSFNSELENIFIIVLNESNIKSLIFNNYMSIDAMEKTCNEYSGYWNNDWRGSRFNKSVNLLVETKLELIEFGARFNKPLDNLPATLQRLILSFNFNQPLDNLPLNLIYLSLKNCSKFNNNLDFLPDSLEILILPENYYSKPINNLPIGTKVHNLEHYKSINNDLVFE